MKDILKKVLFFGLGFVDFTKEKVEALVDEMVKRGEVSQQESPQTVEQILNTAQEMQKALFNKVKQIIVDMNLARAADLEALEKRVAALEAEIKGKSGS
ncbi:MAG: polyhydroxyalkanoate synthesis regulator [Deltaproteobacteria bacterium]|nr:MAG: polyhydroxyalkanoate synthesis regulator [Deltaproteobacteria bacterium]